MSNFMNNFSDLSQWSKQAKTNLKNVNDPAVKDFIIAESYVTAMNNLGVKSAIELLRSSDLIKNPAMTYLLESVFRLENQPEWKTINMVIEKLKPFSWNPTVSKCLSVLTENSSKFALDINMHKALNECSQAKVDNIINPLKEHIYNYLIYKDENVRQILAESLVKYKNEPAIDNLYSIITDRKNDNAVIERVTNLSESEFEKKAGNKQTEFRFRVENLMSKTASSEVYDACQEALQVYKEYNHFGVATDIFEKFELSVSNFLIEKIHLSTDSAAQAFVEIENRINAIKDLGVGKAITAITESNLMKNPATLYSVDALQQYLNRPEYLTIHSVIEHIAPLAWHEVVKEHLNVLGFNAKKYAEDIQIYRALHETKNSKSNFVLSGIQENLNNYLNQRTATNRTKLLENLSRYTYDVNIRNLYNVISESDKFFQLKADSNDAIVKRVFSPTIVFENEEVFSVWGKTYIKLGDKIRPLKEEEYKSLPENFVWLTNFINQPNVEIDDNKVKIFTRDKKVEVYENDNNIYITINGKTINKSEFRDVYLKAGIFNPSERQVIGATEKIVENWNNIFELDFVKSVFPKHAAHRRVDIFRLGHNIHLNREDSLMKESIFYANCNAAQTRNMVMEFANYDLGLTFKDMLSEEEKVVTAFETKKKELLDSINTLKEKKDMLMKYPDAEVRESEEIQDLIAIIEEEISNVKKEYAKLNHNAKSFTTLQEGTNVGDTVEFLKKSNGSWKK